MYNKNTVLIVMAFTWKHLLVLWLLERESLAAEKQNRWSTLFFPSNVFSTSRGVFHIVRQECVHNPSILNLTCVYSAMANSSGNLGVFLDYMRTVSSIVGEIKLLAKPSTGKAYKPTMVRQKWDYCMMSGNQNSPNLLLMFMPPNFEKNVPSCPLFGKYEFNYTLPLFPVDVKIFSQSEYRLDVVFTQDDQVFLWRLVSYLKKMVI